MSPWTVGDWLLVLGSVFTLLGAFGGAAWWMSAMHGQVRQTKRETMQINENFKTLFAKTDNNHTELWRGLRRIKNGLHKIDKRVTVLEERDRLHSRGP